MLGGGGWPTESLTHSHQSPVFCQRNQNRLFHLTQAQRGWSLAGLEIVLLCCPPPNPHEQVATLEHPTTELRAYQWLLGGSGARTPTVDAQVTVERSGRPYLCWRSMQHRPECTGSGQFWDRMIKPFRKFNIKFRQLNACNEGNKMLYNSGNTVINFLYITHSAWQFHFLIPFNAAQCLQNLFD